MRSLLRTQVTLQGHCSPFGDSVIKAWSCDLYHLERMVSIKCPGEREKDCPSLEMLHITPAQISWLCPVARELRSRVLCEQAREGDWMLEDPRYSPLASRAVAYTGPAWLSPQLGFSNTHQPFWLQVKSFFASFTSPIRQQTLSYLFCLVSPGPIHAVLST